MECLVDIIKALENLKKEHEQEMEECVNSIKIIKEIPLKLPEGGGVVSRLEWIKWAKEKLGYPDEKEN